METILIIYIYMKISISWNSTKNHREGNPPLNPPGRCAPPLGQRKTKTISRNTRCFFPWLPVFLIQRYQPTGNPWGASTGWADSVRLRQCSRLADTFRPEQQFFALSTAIFAVRKCADQNAEINFFLEIFSNDIFILSRRKFYIFALRKMGENKSPPIFCVQK